VAGPTSSKGRRASERDRRANGDGESGFDVRAAARAAAAAAAYGATARAGRALRERAEARSRRRESEPEPQPEAETPEPAEDEPEAETPALVQDEPAAETEPDDEAEPPDEDVPALPRRGRPARARASRAHDRLHGAVGAVQLRVARDGGGVSGDDRVLAAHGDLDALALELDEVAGAFPARVNADSEGVERGLAQLVLTLVEFLRQLMERQALRRMEQGTLDDDEIERLGQTFTALARRMDELKAEFGLEDRDLNLSLGPLGDLL
jgi:hypothetical protein